jgi:esterase/lipase superfamily enzyme
MDFKRFASLVLLSAASLTTNPALATDPQQVESLMRLLSNPIAPYKVQAAGALAKLGKDAGQATDLLIASLKDADADVRLYASFALAQVSNDLPKTLEALVPVLDDRDEHVRYSAEWTIAKLSREVSSDMELPADQVSSLHQSLKEALVKLQRQPHQKRHETAVRIAIDHLASLDPLARDIHTDDAIAVDDDAERLAAEAFSHQFESSDRVQRLQLIEQMAKQEERSLLVVRVIFTMAFESNDDAVWDYALQRLGDQAGATLVELFDELDLNSMPQWSSYLLMSFVPESESHVEKLRKILADSNTPYDIHAAAISALGKVARHRPIASQILQNFIAGPNFDAALRSHAVDSLAEFGAVSNEGLTQLWMVLNQADLSELVRDELIAKMHIFAPNSLQVAGQLTAYLHGLGSNEYQFSQVAAALGDFGPIASVGLQELIRGLSSNEDHIRHSCVVAIEKIGDQATPAAEALVDFVANPNVLVSSKTVAARALANMGAAATSQLERQLSSEDALVREHVLRCLAIMGPAARSTMTACRARLRDVNELLPVRMAALAALGAFASDSSAAAKDIEKLIGVNHPTKLRCAALVALAQIQPVSAFSHIGDCELDSEFDLKLAAAFSKHLVGQTTESFVSLLDLLQIDSPENNQAIEDTLMDLGPIIASMLQDTMRDTLAELNQRTCCARVYARLQPPDWPSLVELLSDEMIGKDVYDAIISGWEYDDGLLTVLMAGMEELSTPTIAKARMMQLADYITEGLGAGGDEESWPGFAAARHFESRIEAAQAEMPSIASKNEESVEESQALLIPEPNPLTNVDELGRKLVTVFYGTNRQPVEAIKLSQSNGYGAALGLAIAALATCTLGFLRKKSPHYTLAAVTGLGAVSAIAVRTVHFSDLEKSEMANVEYTGRPSETVEMGYCEVTIPETHKTGELESPNLLLKLEVSPDPQKHIVLKSVRRLEPDSFYNKLGDEMDKRGDSLLVFVHGYNVSFVDAARRTAQMAFDLKYPGAPVFYSWPSQANWYQYRSDRENIEQSVDQIRHFLSDLASKSNAKTINLVAHSMGNVGLTEALAEMTGDTLFNQIVLAAPDIDAEVFKNDIAPKIVTRARRVTLYTSKTDLALIASRYFNHGVRAGDSGSEPVTFPGLETIDATAVDSSLLGHSYYGSNVDVLYDLGQLLKGKSIQERQYLKPAGDEACWMFDETQTARDPSTILRR